MSSPKVETAIWLALKSRVDSLPLNYHRAWPGMPFTPPSGGVPALPLPYLAIGKINAAPSRVLLAPGMKQDRNGFLMITLMHPFGVDSSVYEQIAGTIAEHFKDGTEMRFGKVCVSVPDYPQVVDGYQDNGYFVTPVRIPWRCFA